ncbi:ribonuclease H-like domain-containing protein [Tanacetum coccineum]
MHKGCDRFQSLLSQLEIHGTGVSTEDANQNFLRSLPSAWSQIALVMRTKPCVDSLSFDDLYNNLRVFEFDVKGSTRSSSSTQNVAFVSSESTNNTNDLDEFDLEEMDLKWQVAMISMILKKFHNKSRRKIQFNAKEPVGFDKTKVECYNCHKTWHFARECRSKRNQDSKRKDAWNSRYKAKDNGKRPGKQEESNALITLDGEESYTKLKKLYDEQREQLGDASIEIQAYTQALKKLNTQMSANDKFGLGYGDHIYGSILSYENEVLQSVFMKKESDVENQPLYDRFVTAEGMHVVPPPMTGNYMPFGPDIKIDYSKFTYGPKQSQTSESETQASDFDTCESNSSIETLEFVPEPVVNESNVVSQPKVLSEAPIIKEYESDSDEYVRSINHKTYYLVITDDFSRFSWVFFLRTKDETSAILKDFIRQIENQLNKKVKTFRCDNGTEFKNRDMIEFYGLKGIKREYSNARTP